MNDSLRIHEDGKRCISFNVGKLWKKTAFDYIITIKAAWHSFPRLTPDWISVVVTDIGDVIQNCFIHKPFTVLSFFRFNLEFCSSEVEIRKLSD